MNQIIQISIPDMKCNGCVTAIETALIAKPGVFNVTIDLTNKSATIEATVPASALIEVIRSAGFPASETPRVKQDNSA